MDVTVVYFGFWKWTLLAYVFKFSISVVFSFLFHFVAICCKKGKYFVFSYWGFLFRFLCACLYFLDKEREHIWLNFINSMGWFASTASWWDCVLILHLVFLCVGLFYLELPARFCEHDGLFSHQYVHKKCDLLNLDCPETDEQSCFWYYSSTFYLLLFP